MALGDGTYKLPIAAPLRRTIRKRTSTPSQSCWRNALTRDGIAAAMSVDSLPLDVTWDRFNRLRWLAAPLPGSVATRCEWE